MAAFEDLFNTALLEVLTPVSSVTVPPSNDPSISDNWLQNLEDESTDRKLAFFDENLGFLLLLRFDPDEFETTDDLGIRKPPITLLSFLAHLQITWDASYISSLPTPPSPTPMSGGKLAVPSRTVSIPKPKNNLLTPSHPSIFPPSTPNPVPSTGEADRQYVQAQGTPLRFGTWGESSTDAKDSQAEAFSLIWSGRDKTWIAIYRMSVQVSFMPTKVPDPLLCLTISTTLREKPLAFTAARQSLLALIEAAGGLPTEREPGTPLTIKINGDDDEKADITGLEEVNLLEGLKLNATFASSPLNLPSTRLAPSVRKQSYALPPTTTSPTTPDTAQSSHTLTRNTTSSHATLRKSFRKTLRTVSGFKVRMRTVFVPYFMLSHNGSRRSRNGTPKKLFKDEDSDSDEDDEDHLNERELREAGNEEHTVVLCVEVGNGGESPSGFAVESVKVTVGGEGAQTKLIGWGNDGLETPDRVFPLHLSPMEQYNLLYAVSFLRSPETDEFSLARGRSLPGAPAVQELQRAVTIIINGRPYEFQDEDGLELDASKLKYPTPTFPSRWNCVLDLSPHSQATIPEETTPEERTKIALPTPASPFPGSVSKPLLSATLPENGLLSPMPAAFQTPRPLSFPNNFSSLKSPISGSSTPTGTGPPLAGAVAGSKRYTMSALDSDIVSALSGGDSAKLRNFSPVNYRSGPAMLNPTNQRDPLLQSGIQSNNTAPVNPILSATAVGNKHSYLPPSVTVQSYMQSPTTYGPLSPPLPPVPGNQSYGSFSARASILGQSHTYSHTQEDSISSVTSFDMAVPPTPAYPAYPTSSPSAPTPRWQGPIANLQSGAVGPSVEIKRERGGNVGIPPTPGPTVGAMSSFAQMQGDIIVDGPEDMGSGYKGEGESIVVSVGLLPVRRSPSSNGGVMRGVGKIYPLDQFTVDIFVFNQSSWTRRFEVSYPDRRKQRKGQIAAGIPVIKKGGDDDVGIVPLENRVRIGPLLPSTCQSVRMDFLALSPGVHPVETLTLMDIQTGYTMNLRSVLDVVVHEHELDQNEDN
ncbi:hypothetical protein QCA50_003755 [Cerrena zonata]|uniref:Trafficking protein particle complex II-specific subunit 65 IgD3 domain-containing protein n=1 Tax=Cerrena zonata TaxID=2478898 RepID=A0AAW0GFI5_9APHY